MKALFTIFSTGHLPCSACQNGILAEPVLCQFFDIPVLSTSKMMVVTSRFSMSPQYPISSNDDFTTWLRVVSG